MIRNHLIEKITDGDSESEKIRVVPLPMGAIIEDIQDQSGGFPKRTGAALFVEEDGEVSWLEKPDALMGWLGTVTGSPPKFRSGVGLHTCGHVFAELRRVSEAFEAVEMLPHEPPIEGHFYACKFPEPGDGSTLERLLDFYSPATPTDRDLIKSAFVTPGWGGRGGSRPAFVLTADAGRGVGKTTLANHIGRLWGGVMDTEASEDPGQIKTRLLSPEGLAKRVVLIDNVKSSRFSWAEAEALITSSEISGRRNYIGEASRPNNLTWIITMNGAALSKDLAQRSVIIKLDSPSRSGTWADDVTRFIDDHQRQLIADCVGFLRGDRIGLNGYTRWASWERDILERLPDPLEAQCLIKERQQVVDAEDEESGLLQDFISRKLRELHFDPDRDRIFLPSHVLSEWYRLATNDRNSSTTATSRKLKQGIREGTLPRLMENLCNAYGRGFVWVGPIWDQSDTITDIEARIERMGNSGH